MKRAVCMIVVFALVLALAGCQKQEDTRTLYDDNGLTVTRSGNTITVFDDSGSRCTLTLRRTQKRNVDTVITAKPVIRSDALIVETIGAMLHIATAQKDDIYIKLR